MIYKISSIAKKKYIVETLVNQNQNYIFYLLSDDENNDVKIINGINMNDVKLVANIYNPIELNRKFNQNKINADKKYIDNLVTELNKNETDLIPFSEKTNAVNNINYTIQTVEKDLESVNTTTEIFKILNNIDTNYQNYGKKITK